MLFSPFWLDFLIIAHFVMHSVDTRDLSLRKSTLSWINMDIIWVWCRGFFFVTKQLSTPSFDSWVEKGGEWWNRRLVRGTAASVATNLSKLRLVKSAGCCLCSIEEDYGDKTLMPCDTFSWLNLLPLRDPRPKFPCITVPTQLVRSSSNVLNTRRRTLLSTTMRTVLTLLLLFSLAYHSEFWTVLGQPMILDFAAYTAHFPHRDEIIRCWIFTLVQITLNS